MTGLEAQEAEKLAAQKVLEERLDQELYDSFSTYDEWKVAANAQQSSEGEVSVQLMVVASRKGWLEQWTLVGAQEPESKAAAKRGRLSTEGAAFILQQKEEDWQQVDEVKSDMVVDEGASASAAASAQGAPSRPPIAKSASVAACRDKMAANKAATEAAAAAASAAAPAAPAERPPRSKPPPTRPPQQPASASSSSNQQINICNDAAVDAQLAEMLAGVDSRTGEILAAGKTVNDVKISAMGALVVQEVKDLRSEVIKQKAALDVCKENDRKLMKTTATTAAAVASSEAHRPLITIMKCAGVETATVYELAWPAIARACRNEVRVNEYTCLHGIGRVYCKGEQECREMLGSLTSVLERAGAAEVCYALRGKPSMERAKEEQMAVAFKAIKQSMGCWTKHQRDQVGFMHAWPDREGRWSYSLAEDGDEVITSVLIAGRIDSEAFEVQVYVYDEELYNTYCEIESEQNPAKFLYITKLHRTNTEDDMMKYKPAAKKKEGGGGKGKKGGGKSKDKGGGGGKSKGKQQKGDKHRKQW